MPTGSEGSARPTAGAPRAELFSHDADVGVRGVGPTLESAFEQAALALTSIVTETSNIAGKTAVTIECEAPNEALLLVDWLNALIYRMAVDRLVFGRFRVRIDGTRLHGEAWGEPIDRSRHAPAAEPKGATFTALEVGRSDDGTWTAQCVVDV
ncbi:MAG: archease [Rhodospirillales bacterium]|nr:archease [Rhodospirillales bacterium]